jgi:hypothetical protein
MDSTSQHKLLLAFLSSQADKTKAIQFERLTLSDWREVVQQTVRHGVTPLLFHRLKNLKLDRNVPGDILKELQVTYLRSLTRNIRLFQELTLVLRALRSAGIPVIALKGVHLAKFVYKNIALRPMSDIDLLVHAKDFQKVEEELRGLEYHSKKLYGMESENERSAYIAPFIKRGAAPVDIHVTVEKPNKYFTLDLEDVWRNAQSVSMDELQFSVLSYEDLLLHLCLHTSFLHRFRFGIRSLCDISEMVGYRGQPINWENVIQRSILSRSSKYIYLTLYLTKELLDSPVPEEVLERLKPCEFDLSVVTSIKNQIFRYRDAVATASPVSANLAQLMGKSSVIDKGKLLVKSIFPPKEYIRQKYFVPDRSGWIYLYYPVHFKNLAVRYGRSLWELYRRDKNIAYLAECENNQIQLEDWLR